MRMYILTVFESVLENFLTCALCLRVRLFPASPKKLFSLHVLSWITFIQWSLTATIESLKGTKAERPSMRYYYFVWGVFTNWIARPSVRFISYKAFLLICQFDNTAILMKYQSHTKELSSNNNHKIVSVKGYKLKVRRSHVLHFCFGGLLFRRRCWRNHTYHIWYSRYK